MTQTCDAYKAMGLWDYDFRIKFNTGATDDYIFVPLASFAGNFDQEGGVCVIFVEYLEDFFPDSK